MTTPTPAYNRRNRFVKQILVYGYLFITGKYPPTGEGLAGAGMDKRTPRLTRPHTETFHGGVWQG
jgi:hypothetical protein